MDRGSVERAAASATWGLAAAGGDGDDDLAAWAMRRHGGAPTRWCADGLADDHLIAAWADRALAGARRYADLTFREYRAMRARRN